VKGRGDRWKGENAASRNIARASKREGDVEREREKERERERDTDSHIRKREGERERYRYVRDTRTMAARRDGETRPRRRQ